jgi:hypothetical protein
MQFIMSERISERDLILPALWCINLNSGHPTSTTQLQSLLRELLHPVGEDLIILERRRDDRFSQKVRNLRSHQTLEGLGFAIYESRGNNGFWTITEQGKAFLSNRASGRQDDRSPCCLKTLYIYLSALLLCSTVMTTFPRACPASKYRIASATSLNG